MMEHIGRLLDLQHRIVAAGEDCTDIYLARTICMSLPNTTNWEIVKSSIFQLPKDQFTLDTVKARVLSQANRETREKESETTHALLTVQRSRPPQKRPRKQPNANDECHYCHGKGHWANECPNCKSDDQLKGGNGSAALANVSSLRDLGTRSVGHIYMARITPVRSAPPQLLLDSGASRHIFVDKKWFVDMNTTASHETVTSGNFGESKAEGVGTVAIRCRLADGIRTVLLPNSIYVPSFSDNLVSLGELQKMGANYGRLSRDGWDGGMEVTQGEETLLTARLMSGLYHILGEANAQE